MVDFSSVTLQLRYFCFLRVSGNSPLELHFSSSNQHCPLFDCWWFGFESSFQSRVLIATWFVHGFGVKALWLIWVLFSFIKTGDRQNGGCLLTARNWNMPFSFWEEARGGKDGVARNVTPARVLRRTFCAFQTDSKDEKPTKKLTSSSI